MPVVELETNNRKPPASQGDSLGRDVNRWVWDGLCIALPVLETNRAGWREVVSGAQPSGVFGSVSGQRDARGQAVIRTPGSGGDYVDYTNRPSYNQPSTALTVFARFKWNGVAAWPNALMAKVHTELGHCTWQIHSDDVPGQLIGRIATSAGQYFTDTTGGIGSTAFRNIFLRWRAGEQCSMTVLADGGALVTSSTSVDAITGTLDNGTAPLRIFGSDTTVSIGGDFSVVLGWSRKLTDQECRALAYDPFLPFRRPPRSPTELSFEAGMQFIGPTRS
jgi:hypothetical protein